MRIPCWMLAVVLQLLWAPGAEAWGRDAHRIVAEIAEAHMSAEARAAASKLLGGKSLADVSYWADEIRGSDDQRHTAPWHYVNLPDGWTYNPEFANPKGDVVWAIGNFRDILADSSQSSSDRKAALSWLVHLVADIHQPLHVGRFRDRGGNAIRVSWFGQDSNLHAVWDTGILEAAGRSRSAWVAELVELSPERVRELQAATLDDIIAEAMALRERAYSVPEAGDDGSAYAKAQLATVEDRLQAAGVRLAGLLRPLLKSPADER